MDNELFTSEELVFDDYTEEDFQLSEKDTGNGIYGSCNCRMIC